MESETQKRSAQQILAGILNRESRIRVWAVLFCALLPLVWEGVPFTVIGLPRAGGYYAISLLILISIIILPFRRIDYRIKLSIYSILSICLALLMLTVSVVSGLLFYKNPILSWVPELVYYSPVLLIFVFISFGIRLPEIVAGIALAATVAATLATIDHYSKIYFLDNYIATSGFDFYARRIMLLKNEVGCAICISFAWLATGRKPLVLWASLVILALTFFDMFQIIETRLVIGAAMIACALFSVFYVSNRRKIGGIFIVAIVALAAGPALFGKYIDQAQSMGSIENDKSYQWRALTVDQYQKVFDETYGVGFGIMSIKDFSGNILSYTLHQAPTLHGIERGTWGFYLADISFYGALFQFGVAGLIFTLIMTLMIPISLLRYAKYKNIAGRAGAAAIGLFVLFLLISPWPTNLFTLSWSMLSGNMFWACAARAGYIRGIKKRLDSL